MPPRAKVFPRGNGRVADVRSGQSPDDMQGKERKTTATPIPLCPLWLSIFYSSRFDPQVVPIWAFCPPDLFLSAFFSTVSR
jgi:hypothetical protein